MKCEQRVMLDGVWRAAQIDASCPDGKVPSMENLAFFNACVPGELHEDLHRAGKLPSIFESTQACKENEWVSEADWVYETCFDMPASWTDECVVFLNMDSVDTFADVFVNGELVGVTANAFLRQHLLLRHVKASENRLVVRMKGHLRMVASKAPEAEKRCGLEGETGLRYARSRSLTRRSQRTYSGELTGGGIYITGIGLTKSVSLSVYPPFYIEDFIFRTMRAEKEIALIHLETRAHCTCPGAKVAYQLTAPNGEVTVKGEKPLEASGAVCDFQVKSPQLWWPNGYGPQNLYVLELSLLLEDQCVYSQQALVGIRQVELIRQLPSQKPTFQIRMNGTPLYIFGGNLMPINYLTATGTPAQSETILDLAVHAGINMMRLWGGGNNESEWFYQMCDRKGIMIFKEMHLHSHTYPDYDPAFVDEVVHESAQTIRYLRNHPCLALISGGNEQQEGWDAWHWREQIDAFYGATLIYQKLGPVAQQECPEIAYIPNSPHGKKLSQSPVDGETHTWGNFYNVTKDPQFVTETCWFYGSYPHPKTLEKYMGIRMENYEGFGWHNKWHDLTGQELIGNHQYGEYHLLGSLAQYMKSMEIEQFLADYHALFYLRCRSSSCNGIIYWPFNKGGLFILFGCVDYDQRPQMSYYLLRRLFAPVACHLYRDVNDIRFVASSVRREIVHAQCVIKHMHTDGRVLQTWCKNIDIHPGNSMRLMDLADCYQTVNDRWNEMFRAEVYENGKQLSYDDLYFCSWSEFENHNDAPRVLAERPDDRVVLTISCDALAKMIYLDSDSKLLFEDNCFSLMPGESRSVWVKAMDQTKSARVRVESLDGGSTSADVTFA